MFFDVTTRADKFEIPKTIVATVPINVMHNQEGCPAFGKLALRAVESGDQAASLTCVAVPLPNQFSNSRS